MQPPYLHVGVPAGLLGLSIGVTYVFLAAWIKLVVAPRPLGNARVIASLPVLLVNLVCPWFFNPKEEVLQRLSTVFILSWLCSFKVLAFCWGRAPLRESMTVPQIASVIMLPLFPKPPDSSTGPAPRGRLQDSAGSGVSLAGRWLGKIVLLGTVVVLILQYGDAMPDCVRYFTYAFGLYSFVGFLMDGPAALAVEALGLQVIPTFDQPWMSASVADFWGRRWNIPTTSVLRTVVYDVIVDGSLINPARLHAVGQEGKSQGKASARGSALAPLGPAPQAGEAAAPPHQPGQQQQQQQPEPPQPRRRPSMLRRQLGLHATFFVSGVVHEYIAWLVKLDGKWGWKWTVFFWAQAPLMTLEAYGSQLMQRAGIELPRWLAIPLTLVVLEAVSHELFFGFVERDTDLAQRVLREVSSSYSALLAPLQPVLANVIAALQRL